MQWMHFPQVQRSGLDASCEQVQTGEGKPDARHSNAKGRYNMVLVLPQASLSLPIPGNLTCQHASSQIKLNDIGGKRCQDHPSGS